ncbi:hypothetical protein NONI108955_10850 [Nocardia ninae]|uniref:Uncharacterized protein n=1 Tax=Nocardia ninae NBRC 108245 TaxID=1210091 RepID=A0A511MN02_9NOCA|nr:hypothetical protein [Nocardia ninae]GEM42004.1 hypothetical protein NN4_65230 [Nocardia ninae NBRC 108245]
MTIRRAAIAAALLIALAGCSTDQSSSPAPASATTAPSDSNAKSEMVATARGVITGQVSRSGYTAVNFGTPKFPTALEVIMPADVVTTDGTRSTMWFRVGFASAGGSLTPLGTAEVGITEADVS